jgi:hypothetical protein
MSAAELLAALGHPVTPPPKVRASPIRPQTRSRGDRVIKSQMANLDLLFRTLEGSSVANT